MHVQRRRKSRRDDRLDESKRAVLAAVALIVMRLLRNQTARPSSGRRNCASETVVCAAVIGIFISWLVAL